MRTFKTGANNENIKIAAISSEFGMGTGPIKEFQFNKMHFV